MKCSRHDLLNVEKLYIYIYIYIYTHICISTVYVYIYIYIYRERDMGMISSATPGCSAQHFANFRVPEC